MAGSTNLYSELSKYISYKDITILIDGDYFHDSTKKGLKYYYDSAANHLTISSIGLTGQDKEDVLRLIQEVQDIGFLLLDAEQKEILESYQGYNDYNPYLDSLNLFTGKIPSNDLNALKMSFYMKIKSEHGENISDIKRQIRDRFSSRGAYISNLCSAGYFEGVFRKEALRLDSGKFKEYYELRVGLELAALFIHEGLTEKSIIKILDEKVSLCSQNGIWKFKIHAFGRSNVSLIKEVTQNWASEIEVKIRTVSEDPKQLSFIDMEVEII